MLNSRDEMVEEERRRTRSDTPVGRIAETAEAVESRQDSGTSWLDL
jgi:hypothetical protein